MLNSIENQHSIIIQWCNFCTHNRLEEKDVVRTLVTACSKEQDPAGMSLTKSRSSRAVLMSSSTSGGRSEACFSISSQVRVHSKSYSIKHLRLSNSALASNNRIDTDLCF